MELTPPGKMIDVPRQVGGGAVQGALSLRDKFAEAALIGHIASMAHPQVNPGSEPKWELMAACCYRAADAMLAEREKKS